MNLEKYPYQTNASHLDYEFDSEGPKGKIRKVARFTILGTNLYNFGFGDLDLLTGKISDSIVSNNGDGKKILSTVAMIIYDFTKVYMYAAIFIKGSSETRTRWYQMGISHHWSEIASIFAIFGYKDEKWELFRKGINYQAFLGRLKKPFLL